MSKIFSEILWNGIPLQFPPGISSQFVMEFHKNPAEFRSAEFRGTEFRVLEILWYGIPRNTIFRAHNTAVTEFRGTKHGIPCHLKRNSGMPE